MATEPLRPNAPGDECNIASQGGCSACPNHYDCVYEESPDEDTTYVNEWLSDTFQIDLYNIADSGVGAGTINHIIVYARCRATGTPTQTSLKIAMRTGGVTYEGDEETLTTGYVDYSKQWTQNPGNAHAWTWDEIDALQIGIALRKPATGKASFCTQVYVVVDYSPPVVAIGRSFGFIIG